MKKFLFTLAALLMAGSLSAEEYLYIDDMELTQDQLGTQIQVPVKAHFDYAVSAWDMYLTLPEGITVTAWEEGDDLLEIPYVNQSGKSKTLEGSVTTTDKLHYIAITSAMTQGYYQVDGEWVPYGAVKWLPGEYEDGMLLITLAIAADFNGGEILVVTEPSCGADAREDVTPCPKNQHNEKVCTVTVEGGTVEPEVTATPVITVENNEEGEYLMISASGDGTVKLYIDGMEVPNPFQYNYQDEEHDITITATAQEDGKEISETAELVYTVPAKTQEPPTPQVTEKPVITYFVDMDAETVTITATGNGTVILYNDDVEVARGEGVATYVVPFTEDPEGEEMGFSATAQEEGKEVSEYALATIEIPGKQPQPYETPAPEITTELTDDALVITATGEGTVTLYVQYINMETGELTTETYEGEGTVTQEIPRGEEDTYINFWAVAQADEDAVPGTTGVEYFFEVPAKETEPVDPEHHDEGVWIVTISTDGLTEWWHEMMPSEGDYTCIVRNRYGELGHFPYDPNKTNEENDALRPDIHYYIVIDGVRYGAEEDGAITVLGESVYNPLFVNENTYVLEHGLGRTYNMGVAIDEMTGEIYGVYAAVAPGYTEVEEMNADKAVAGVRYFNMAGQEMQEANGMTIVVTTYTDGTTSAVKVIK